MIEKRTSRRASLVARVDVQGQGYAFLAVAENISEGGMRINTANPRPPGEKLRVKFVVPETQQIVEVHARICHVVPGTAMGVEFLNLGEETRHAIRKLIS